MKRFLCNLFAIAGGFVAIVAGWLAVRTWLWQDDVRNVFALPAGTEALMIGNSHVGCTWAEDSRYKNRVLWHSGTYLRFALMRLLECERLNDLDAVKILIVNCDQFGGIPDTCAKMRDSFAESFPFAWRYLWLMPADKTALVDKKLFGDWSISNNPPATEMPWSERSPAERALNIRNNYYEMLMHFDTAAHECFDPSVFDTISRIKDVCDRHKIRLVLYAAPLVSENPVRMDPARYTPMFDEGAARLRDMGVEFYDFRAAVDDKCFRDCHHLSIEGAQAFTEWFYRQYVPEIDLQ
ncbi:MAG: hypothetical protein IJ802_03985 [Kiritimatiellae bacterium]|nr:hypothetical protein [Kiritimatiellia bacterium]